jgi:hypothetical protein
LARCERAALPQKAARIARVTRASRKTQLHSLHVHVPRLDEAGPPRARPRRCTPRRSAAPTSRRPRYRTPSSPRTTQRCSQECRKHQHSGKRATSQATGPPGTHARPFARSPQIREIYFVA